MEREHDLDALRRILLKLEYERLDLLSEDVADLHRLMADKDALAVFIAPSLETALRTQIRENSAEMVEALYPIIGQLVLRAVTEAIQDLARSVDARVRTTITPKALLRRARGLATGVSDGEMSLREALPFEVSEVFLIHRTSGLLLRHISPREETAIDRDLVSGMFTAIRDFVADAFGREQTSELEMIEYGDRRILIEAAEHVYLAVVVLGVEPPGYRANMRSLLFTIEQRYRFILHNYQGDATPFETMDVPMAQLQDDTIAELRERSAQLTSSQKLIAATVITLVFLCLGLACWTSFWTVNTVRQLQNSLSATQTVLAVAPAQPIVIVMSPTVTPIPTIAAPSATPLLSATVTATVSPTPTTTATPTASPTPTAIATPTAMVQPTSVTRVLVQADRLNVRSGPGLTYSVESVVVRGAEFVLQQSSEDDAWLNICCQSDNRSGWIAAGYAELGSP